MADTKVTALTAATVASDDDLLYVVDDPAGTPTSKKITVANFITSIQGTGSGDVSAGNHLHTGVYEPANANLLETTDIGVSVQAFDADLTTIAGITATTDNFIQSKSSAWASRTPTQVTADLIAVVGDSGAGGVKGLVPAPAAGDAAAGKFLKADGVWTAPSGSGDVVGPGSATDNAIARYDGTTGKLIQNSAATVADTSGDITAGAYNKVTITAPATSATLTIANSKTATINNTITLAGTDSTTITFQATDTYVGRATTDTLTNKTLTSPTLTTPSAFTTGGTITLAENTSIALDPAGSADGKYSGITVEATGGAVIAFGDLVTLDVDDSRWELVDISVAAGATGDARGVLGMAVTSSTDGAALTVLLHGIIRADANFPALTIGAPVYATTGGNIVVAQPVTVDHVIRIVGYALTADEIYFNPGNSWITHT